VEGQEISHKFAYITPVSVVQTQLVEGHVTCNGVTQECIYENYDTSRVITEKGTDIDGRILDHKHLAIISYTSYPLLMNHSVYTLSK
jgi:hypothetical protein